MTGDAAQSPAKPPGRKPRRLILCLDGTWNTSSSAAITNIVRLRDMLAPGDVGDIEQRIYYDEGVGTLDDRVRGGVLGIGLDRNVRQAYRFLSQFYDTGDEIYIFGFSRGAFTARSLAGYIGASGLLTRATCTPELEQRAWANYRVDAKDRYPSETLLLQGLCHQDLRINLLGVFDTVGSLGVPISFANSWNRRHFEFHDTKLSSIIDVSLHALAIDERRGPFAPALWEVPQHASFVTVEQVWFAGAHSDIGGGYGDGGIGALTLHWMLSRIDSLNMAGERRPLVLRPGELQALKPNALGAIHNSSTTGWLYSRYKPCIRVLAQQRPTETDGIRLAAMAPHARPIGEHVHLSVLERCESAGGKDQHGQSPYAPPNLQCALKAMFDPAQHAQRTVALGFVGKDGRPLDWVTDAADYAALEAAMPNDYRPQMKAARAAWKSQQPVTPAPRTVRSSP
ncbi:MAG TPA: DUF2235 domain-containing protein [Ancylobacter sp.]